MGEVANDMIEGRACSYCGCYFVTPKGELYEHGYPVACTDCYEEDCELPKADMETL